MAFRYGMWDLVPRPGIYPSLLRWEHSLCRWTTREVLTVDDFNSMMDEAISVQPLSE